MIATIILILIHLIVLIRDIIRHGEGRTYKYNGVTMFIGVVLTFTLYYFAGLFDKFNVLFE